MTTPKYQLPGTGFFYRDDQQLRRSFRPWLRWLPCPILWKLSVWWYYHAGKASKKQVLFRIFAVGGINLLFGVWLVLLTGLWVGFAIYAALIVIVVALLSGMIIAE